MLEGKKTKERNKRMEGVNENMKGLSEKTGRGGWKRGCRG